jgi:3-oxoacyl-[acyl-carrier-protein] synthase II
MTQKDCRPFDKERTGMVVGEGAAMLMLEDYDHAVARGATIYADVSGYALACDAHHVTAPEPNGTGAIQAMGSALKMADISSEDVSYISAHGTGTRANDSHEINAMLNIFKDRFTDVPVQGLKSMTGHCMGAASALEAVSAVMSIRNQIIPATLNTTNLEEKEGKSPRILKTPLKDNRVKHVLSNSFAFGGNICSVLFSDPNLN